MVMPDHWIRRMALEQGMIEPFVEAQIRDGVISYGLSSYGYDARVGDHFKIFHNVDSAVVDPKNFSSASFVDRHGPVCTIPPNSFVLAQTVERFRIPRDVLVICVGQIDLCSVRHHRERHALGARVGRDGDVGILEHDTVAGQDLCRRGCLPVSFPQGRIALRSFLRRSQGQVHEPTGRDIAASGVTGRGPAVS